MGGKRKDASRHADAKSDAAAVPSRPSGKAKSKGKSDGSNVVSMLRSWPWWLWAMVIIGLLASLGRLMANEPSSQSRNARKRGRKSDEGEGAGVRGELELVMRLSELTQLASGLVSTGEMDALIAKEIDEELAGIEEETNAMNGKVARDIRAMVSVVRGTLYQKSEHLSDEEVEKLNNSFTYSNPRYWEDYYKKTSEEERYDWYATWDTPIVRTTFTPAGGAAVEAWNLGDVLRPYLRKDAQILMLGCGNSDLSEHMYRAGYQEIVNIDISEKVIENLQSRLEADMPQMKWQHMSAADQAFEEASFDVTIEKGTFDAIEQNKSLLAASVKETHRTLRPGGLLLSITFNRAAIRVEEQLQSAASWGECDSHEFIKEQQSAGTDGKQTFFVHACRRPSRA